MNNFEKIIELAQRRNLTKDEQETLNSLLENDSEAQKLFNVYDKIGKTLQPPHISYDKLRDYVLIKNGLNPEEELDHAGAYELENHLKECSVCAREFRILSEEFSNIHSFVSSSLNGAAEKNAEFTQMGFIRKQISPRFYPLFAVFILGFIYLFLYLVSGLTTPKSYTLASLEDDPGFYVTRGRGTVEFQQSLNAIENENYEDAIIYLKKDIEKYPDDETIFYTYYIMGLSQLGAAEKRFAGLDLFLMFDKTRARQALESFKICTEKNNLSKFPDINYNAYYYSAKASLMLGNIESAKKYLQLVIDNKGSKMSEAQNILTELE